MHYFDDILNVYAYLFSKTGENVETGKQIAQALQKLQMDNREDKEKLDELQQQSDELLEDSIAIAKKLGIDISDILEERQRSLDDEPLKQKSPAPKSHKTVYPKGYDYEKDFQELVKEAHAAGFTDVHPEQMLTQEELARATAFAEQLDMEFERATGLQKKDMIVLMVAVVCRVICHALMQTVDAALEEVVESGNLPDDTAIDAASGVDIDDMLKESAKRSLAAEAGSGRELSAETKLPQGNLLPKVLRRISGPVRFRDRDHILRECPSFDLEDSTAIPRESIVGYDKHLGWFFGVVNILTDTVTTKSMKSYSVARRTYGDARPFVDREVSTLFSVVYPALQNAAQSKNEIVAAVLQEAVALGVAKSDRREIVTVFDRATTLQQYTERFTNGANRIGKDMMPKWSSHVKELAASAFISTVVAAIHALLYDGSDGDVELYAVRTNKILVYSNAIAAMVNSIPALITEDVTKLDLAGVLSTLLSAFHSVSFWIETKANFLVSAYRKELDPLLEQADALLMKMGG